MAIPHLFWVSILLVLVISPFVRPLSPVEPITDSGKTAHDGGDDLLVPPANPSPSPEQHPAPREQVFPFHPSIAVVVGLLTTMFSATFLLLLYARHCKPGSGYISTQNTYSTYPLGGGTAGRKNSGIDRAVIESLPVFRFESLSGHKDGLECAVCLAMFDSLEVLRLLPKCKHAFHVECIDTWLNAHSTCPLCRYRVDPEDVLLVDRQPISLQPQNHIIEIGEDANHPVVRRISGRHSSGGERGRFLQFFQHKRRSLDLMNKKSDSSGNLGRFDWNIRKDGFLLNKGRPDHDPSSVENSGERTSTERRKRLDHRIIISRGNWQRWSNVEPSDLLYLQSEMIMCSSNHRIGKDRRDMINERSMSEITCLSRF